jgi:hypothetical protein
VLPLSQKQLINELALNAVPEWPHDARAGVLVELPPEEMFKAGASGRKMIDDDAIRAAANIPWRETAQF